MEQYTFDGYLITPTPASAAATEKLSHFITDTEHPCVEITPRDMRKNRRLCIQVIRTNDEDVFNVIIGLVPKKCYSWEDVKLDPSFALECRMVHGRLVETGIIFAHLRNPETGLMRTVYNRNKIKGSFDLFVSRKNSDSSGQDKNMSEADRFLSKMRKRPCETPIGIDEEFDTFMNMIDTSDYLENCRAKKELDTSVYSM